MSDLKLIRPVAGFDLSETEDFTAVSLEFPLPDGRIFIMSHSFVPQDKYNRDVDRQPTYRKWEAEGDLTIVPGKMVDYESTFLIRFVKKIKNIVSDKSILIRRKQFLVSALEQEGFNTGSYSSGVYHIGWTNTKLQRVDDC